MSRFHGIVGGMLIVGVTLAVLAGHGHAQVKFAQDTVPGPGAGQATLRMPWEAQPQPVGNSNPTMQALLGTTNSGEFRPIPPYQEPPDPNKDILVTKAQGPWMICVHWYEGPQAHQMAREMVLDLRDNYKLSAYVFNRGADERRKEYERVKAIIEKHRAFLMESKLPAGTPLHVKTRRIQEQCAILVGNYPDAEVARRELDRIRKLPPPDPNRVKLATIYKGEVDDKSDKIVAGKQGEHAYVNPFGTAFVVHNPLIKIERPAEWQEQDMAVLRKLNQGEEYSLFKCRKPYTLMVKEFLLPAVVQSRNSGKAGGGGFLESIGLKKVVTNSENAALNAHNMAMLFHKVKLDGYVLHTRYSSIVTVGGFDGPDDPTLKATQEVLTNRLKIPQAVAIQVPR